MMPAALLAAMAAATGVPAVWDLLGALPGAAAAARRTLAPLDGAPTKAERRRAAALLACALLAAGWLTAGLVPALVLAAAAPVAARTVVAARRRRRRAELVAAAPLVARALADALSGGHSVRGALEEAAARGGIAGAAGAELRAVAGRLALGEKTDAALAALRDAANAPAYDTLVAAILLQRDAGGDLAALLRDLAGSLERAGRSAPGPRPPAPAGRGGRPRRPPARPRGLAGGGGPRRRRRPRRPRPGALHRRARHRAAARRPRHRRARAARAGRSHPRLPAGRGPAR